MARTTFGGTLADFIATRTSGAWRNAGPVTITLWSAQTGGEQLTDLLLDGQAVTSIRVGSEGQVPAFQGPDGVLELWAQVGDSPRRARMTAATGDMVTAALAAADSAEESRSAAEAAAAEATEISGIDTLDEGNEALIASPTSKTREALSEQFVSFVKAPTDGTSALAAIQAAVDAAAGRPLWLPPGDYTVDGSVTGNKLNLTLAAGARLIQTVNAPILEIAGGASGSSRALQSSAAAGQNIVNCNTAAVAGSAIQAGDWVIIRGSEAFPGSPKGTKYGEVHQVRQVDGTTQFRTMSNLDFSYTTAATVAKLAIATGVRLYGGELVNAIGPDLKTPLARFTTCVDLEVDTSVRDAGGPGVTISSSALFNVRARVRGSIDDESNGNFGYGVEAFGATCHGEVYVDMVGGRHAFTTTSGATTAGVPRNITVRGRAEGTTNTAWDTHEEGYDITFDGVQATGCRNGAVKHRSPRSRVIDPVVRNCLGIAVRFAPTGTGGRLDGGDLREVRYLSNGSPGIGVQVQAPDVTVVGDPLIECDDQGISVGNGVDNTRLLSATIRAGRRGNAATSIGVEFLGASAGHRVGREVYVEEAVTRMAIPAGVSLLSRRRPARRLDLLILATPHSQVGFDTVQNASASWQSTRRLSAGAQNDEVVFLVSLEAGTYTLDTFHDTSNARGIYTVSVADVENETPGSYADVGTFDGYAASGTRVVNSIGGIVVARDGVKAIRYRMATKNAASSSFAASMSQAVLVRTS